MDGLADALWAGLDYDGQTRPKRGHSPDVRVVRRHRAQGRYDRSGEV
jgi:hypothetical protein